MPKQSKQPIFLMLGYNLQKVQYQRIDNESVEEVKISLLSTDYNDDKKIYSLVIGVEIDFQNSKGNIFEFISGYKINDSEFLKHESINSVLAASVFSYIRSQITSITADTRKPIILPTLDLRVLDLGQSIVLSRENSTKK